MQEPAGQPRLEARCAVNAERRPLVLLLSDAEDFRLAVRQRRARSTADHERGPGMTGNRRFDDGIDEHEVQARLDAVGPARQAEGGDQRQKQGET